MADGFRRDRRSVRRAARLPRSARLPDARPRRAGAAMTCAAAAAIEQARAAGPSAGVLRARLRPQRRGRRHLAADDRPRGECRGGDRRDPPGRPRIVLDAACTRRHRPALQGVTDDQLGSPVSSPDRCCRMSARSRPRRRWAVALADRGGLARFAAAGGPDRGNFQVLLAAMLSLVALLGCRRGLFGGSRRVRCRLVPPGSLPNPTALDFDNLDEALMRAWPVSAATSRAIHRRPHRRRASPAPLSSGNAGAAAVVWSSSPAVLCRVVGAMVIAAARSPLG